MPARQSGDEPIAEPECAVQPQREKNGCEIGQPKFDGKEAESGDYHGLLLEICRVRLVEPRYGESRVACAFHRDEIDVNRAERSRADRHLHRDESDLFPGAFRVQTPHDPREADDRAPVLAGADLLDIFRRAEGAIDTPAAGMASMQVVIILRQS